MREIACDVAVIGAGTAGIAAHAAARTAGARALLIEAGPGGTTCARVGCMPSKLLIAAGAAAHAARGAGLFGLDVPEVRVEGRAVLGRLRAERDRFVASVLDGLDALPADERLSGRAWFEEPGRLRVGEDVRVGYRAAVVATGSSPSVPKPLRDLGGRVLTTDTVFEIPDLPRSLAVLGGGPVGIEIAQAMARLGVEVCLFDTGRSLAGLSHPDLAAAAAEVFGAEIGLHLGVEVTAGAIDGDGVRLAWTAPGGGQEERRFERVLAAAGRPPNVAGLGLDAAGLSLGETGLPPFDPRTLLCEGAPILIAGDASAERPILHEAARQGRIAGANAAALAAGRPLAAPEPWVDLRMVFTHPQAASVGAPYDAAAGESRVTGAMSFCDQGRARVEGEARGGMRVWADRGGRLLGGEMLGPGVEHLSQLLALAVQEGMGAAHLRDRPFYHPTLEEGLETALADIVRQVRA
ncbi:dihydrolipoyl dehydrogenase [Methylobacterium oxalidis]|uniref:Dihydrolipoyl dehydrogenase n=1 Tax=Methylobacterium oxalidis TaxID=944322 RepID=A0A512IWG3_9HYPH|nr:dihydrolipoyl dehydrogenase [Methylobacterium oxalidis]GEP02048.1 dihydrolipoyl dehydrogenase [Methylobacterium oxalidis]GJE31897.1 Dihydrolipoyl dehydrogenase [Methylobacterium oxalidis]GLS61993.1 dihydrolipoyl dehydrogenase [Methylobacterium oxalidis]